MNKIKNYGGLEYVVIKTKKDSIPFDLSKKIEHEIAIKILQFYPIRGKELFFLRKMIGLSCSKMSTEMGGDIDPSTISRFERKQDERLSPINEVYFRSYFLEKLEIKMDAKRSKLLPSSCEDIIELAA